MAVLRFTASGVVPAPTTVQIRVTRGLPGRVPAGAPEPQRSLDDDEIRANLHFFTVGLRGPRTRPCTGLVLSGIALGDRPGLAELVTEARGWGLERATLHLGRGQRPALGVSPLATCIDDVAIVVASSQDVEDVAALRASGLGVSAVVSLDAATLPVAETLAAGLAAVDPTRVVLTWPLQDPGAPPASAVVPALARPVAILAGAGVPTGIKGLPHCALGALAPLAWKSRNRWYVDAAHQRDDALLFFPDVVRFAKVDDCRFCTADEVCDGAPAAHLAAGRVGPLRPIG